MGNGIASYIQDFPNIVVHFKQVQKAISQPHTYILLNTLPENEQDCLIQSTILAAVEQDMINDLLKQKKLKTRIIIYGKNNQDISVYTRYKQLYSLGFTNTSIYIGGLFEWVCLQDIYDDESFPTTSKVDDLLRYGGRSPP